MVLACISISLFIQYLPTANLSPESATLFTEFLMNCSLANHLVLFKSDNFCLVPHSHTQRLPDFRYLALEPLLGSY